MSYITFDYQCTDCDFLESRLVQRDAIDKQGHHCPAQTHKPNPVYWKPLVRLPAAPRTHFRFNDRTLKD